MCSSPMSCRCLGAMLRIVLPPRVDGGEPEVITAWNAPGVGKDRPVERFAARGASRSPGATARSAPSWSERLVRDQRSSPSAAVVEAWQNRSGNAQSADGAAVRRRLNIEVLGAVGASMLLLLVEVVLSR